MTEKKPNQKKKEKDSKTVSFDEFVGALLKVPRKLVPKKRKPPKKDSGDVP